MSTLSVQAWRTWSGNTKTPDDSFVQAAIDAAESEIRSHCSRQFTTPTVAAARVYIPRGGTLLSIHDAATVTAVVDDGTTLTLGTDYQLEPLNSLDEAGEYTPYTHLRRIGGGCWTHSYDKATVSVTGTWGWTALPAAFTESAKVLTSDIINQKDIRGGIQGFGEFGVVRVRENAMVSMLLARFVRAESFGLA